MFFDQLYSDPGMGAAFYDLLVGELRDTPAFPGATAENSVPYPPHKKIGIIDRCLFYGFW